MVSIPFTRVRLDENTQDSTKNTLDETKMTLDKGENRKQKNEEHILEFCIIPRNILEIAELLKWL